MQHLDLVSLHCFVEAARTGSIRKASEQLHMTPSAISRRIAALEHRLQTALFIRTASGVVLTPSGDILLDKADEISRKVSEIQGLIDDIDGLQRGELTIYCMEGAVDHWIGKILANYHSDHPGIQFRTVVSSTDHSIAALIKGECDIAIVLRAPRRSEINVVKSGSERVVVAAAPSHPVGSAGHSIGLLAALRHNVVLPRSDFGVRQLIDRKVALRNGTMKVTFTANSIAMVRSLVRYGSVITLLPYLSVRNECELGLLKAIEISPPDEINAQIDVCVNRDRPLTAAARELLTRISDSFSSFVSGG